MGIDGHCVPTRLGWHIVQGAEVGVWVADRIAGEFYSETSSAIGLEKDGVIVAGVIYENWNRASIFCHIAIEARLTKAYLKAIFDYPFNVCNVKKIIVPVVSNHVKSIKLVTNMGFAEEARIVDGSQDGDIIFLTMTKENCRFLGVRYG
jgi:RimJ/RimL family protein N-acetyltransferase